MSRRQSRRLFPHLLVGMAVLLLLATGFLTACEYPGVPPLAAFPVLEEEAAQEELPGEAVEPSKEPTPGPTEEPTPKAGPQEEPTPEAGPQEEPTPEAGPQEEPTPEAGPPEGRVEVFLRDFRLDPDTLTVKAGKITFVLGNRGRYTHDFRVEGQRMDEKAPKVGAGRTKEWEITLEPGEYNISCPISNHADRGMTGTLVVSE